MPTSGSDDSQPGSVMLKSDHRLAQAAIVERCQILANLLRGVLERETMQPTKSDALIRVGFV